MANRTVLVDNNTVYTKHIARIARVLSLPEEKSYQIARELDADYVLVVFGGRSGYSSDDINKGLWPIRIGHAAFGDTPESDYINPRSGYVIGLDAPPAWRNSMLYRFSYYRFNDIQ